MVGMLRLYSEDEAQRCDCKEEEKVEIKDSQVFGGSKT